MEIYSQYGQDSLLKQFFDIKNIKNGFYLDVGSLDGIFLSNTYLLEKEGWDGICVEPHPSYFPMLQANRRSKCYDCAAGDRDQDFCTFSANYRSSLSSLDLSKESFFLDPTNGYVPYYGDRSKSEIQGMINGKIKVPMKKIDSILEENNVTDIDLIVIDVDGSEPYTLKGLTLAKWNPTILLLEYSVVGDFVFDYAAKNGYYFATRCGSDDIFCRKKSDVEIMKSVRVIGKRNPLSQKHPLERS